MNIKLRFHHFVCNKNYQLHYQYSPYSPIFIKRNFLCKKRDLGVLLWEKKLEDKIKGEDVENDYIAIS